MAQLCCAVCVSSCYFTDRRLGRKQGRQKVYDTALMVPVEICCQESFGELRNCELIISRKDRPGNLMMATDTQQRTMKPRQTSSNRSLLEADGKRQKPQHTLLFLGVFQHGELPMKEGI